MTNSISIKNIGKCYKIYPSRNDRLKEWIWPFTHKQHTEKWVLRNINLEVAKGEAVGIIGMNGAGKSTLLKIITGTTIPTTGSVEFHGSVAALLELGLGFHPDFTGRQNVYMSGQLLGYTNEEITECMQQVEAFAEIGDAIDAPVRTYSSGMQVRLAFSVATMKRPDILIVDEALSVGDIYFQHKSFNRIKEFRDQGTTLLLVSHDKSAIQAVCNRAILLDHGNMIKIGSPEEVMDYYNAMIGDNKESQIKQHTLADGRVQTVSGTGEVKTEKIYFLNEKGQQAEVFKVGEMVTLHIKIHVIKSIKNLVCGFGIKNNLGMVIYGTNTLLNDILIKNTTPKEIIDITFKFILDIGVGNYTINTSLAGGETHMEKNYEWKELGVVFQVIEYDSHRFEGLSHLTPKISVSRNGKELE